MLQQSGDDLNDFAPRIDHPARIALIHLLDALELVVSLGIVFIGRAQFVSDRRKPTRFEHLHHHRRARTRQPRHDGDEFSLISSR